VECAGAKWREASKREATHFLTIDGSFGFFLGGFEISKVSKGVDALYFTQVECAVFDWPFL
jgi:hypothetical protein